MAAEPADRIFINPLHDLEWALGSTPHALKVFSSIFAHMHEAIIDSWQQFREGNKKIADEKKVDDRNREERVSDEKGRQLEITKRKIQLISYQKFLSAQDKS